MANKGLKIALSVVFAVCGIARVLASDEEDAKLSLKRIGESSSFIDFSLGELETAFGELKRTSVIREAENAAREQENLRKREQWKKRLDKLEREVAELDVYRIEEDELDGALESLSEGDDVMKDTRANVEQIHENIQDMKTYLEKSLVSVDTELSSVKQSAISRNVEVAGVVLYAGIGSACAHDTDCVLRNSECRHDVCQCDPGLNFDSLRNECTKSCLIYGSTYQFTRHMIIQDFNNVDLANKTLAECKHECERPDLDFTCRSMDYFPDWKMCYLSETTVTEVPDSSWVYNSAGIHLQRDCSYEE